MHCSFSDSALYSTVLYRMLAFIKNRSNFLSLYTRLSTPSIFYFFINAFHASCFRKILASSKRSGAYFWIGICYIWTFLGLQLLILFKWTPSWILFFISACYYYHFNRAFFSWDTNNGHMKCMMWYLILFPTIYFLRCDSQ